MEPTVSGFVLLINGTVITSEQKQKASKYAKSVLSRFSPFNIRQKIQEVGVEAIASEFRIPAYYVEYYAYAEKKFHLTIPLILSKPINMPVKLANNNIHIQTVNNIGLTWWNITPFLKQNKKNIYAFNKKYRSPISKLLPYSLDEVLDMLDSLSFNKTAKKLGVHVTFLEKYLINYRLNPEQFKQKVRRDITSTFSYPIEEVVDYLDSHTITDTLRKYNISSGSLDTILKKNGYSPEKYHHKS